MPQANIRAMAVSPGDQLHLFHAGGGGEQLGYLDVKQDGLVLKTMPGVAGGLFKLDEQVGMTQSGATQSADMGMGMESKRQLFRQILAAMIMAKDLSAAMSPYDVVKQTDSVLLRAAELTRAAWDKEQELIQSE
jgi:hypothetical protein